MRIVENLFSKFSRQRQRIAPNELCSNGAEQETITYGSAASLFLLDYVTVQWYPKFPARYSEFPLKIQQQRVDITFKHFLYLKTKSFTLKYVGRHYFCF